MLGEKSDGAGAQSQQAELALVAAGERHHALVRVRLEDPTGRQDSIEPGHHDVHQHDVRLVVQAEFHGLVPVLRLRDHGHARSLQRALDHAASEWVVVRDDHAQRRFR